MTDIALKKTARLYLFTSKQLILETWVLGLTLERYVCKYTKRSIFLSNAQILIGIIIENFSVEVPDQYFGQFASILTTN